MVSLAMPLPPQSRSLSPIRVTSSFPSFSICTFCTWICVWILSNILYIFVDGTYLIRVHCSRNLVFCVYYILSACLLFTLYTTFLYVSKKIIFFLGVKVKLIFFLCLMVQILYNFPKDVKIMALMTFWINICTGFSRIGCFSALAYCIEGTRKIIAWMKINSQPGN